MDELGETVFQANQILDGRHRLSHYDLDADVMVLARQFLRQKETADAYRDALEKIHDLAKAWMFNLSDDKQVFAWSRVAVVCERVGIVPEAKRITKDLCK